MRLTPALPLIAVCFAASALVACGGGSSQSGPPDSSKIPTATLPAQLPEPKLLSGAVIQPGGSATYTIKNDDTLASIATRLGISLEDLLDANPGIDPSTLRVGQTIRLPENTDPAATPEPEPTAAPEPTEDVAPATLAPEPTEAPPTEPPAPVETPAPEATPTASTLGQTYVVQSGDIPVTIAEKFGITVEELLAANPGIDPTGLQVGQVLIIPPATPDE
jgi:LysM repeat protein